MAGRSSKVEVLKGKSGISECIKAFKGPVFRNNYEDIFGKRKNSIPEEEPAKKKD